MWYCLVGTEGLSLDKAESPVFPEHTHLTQQERFDQTLILG